MQLEISLNLLNTVLFSWLEQSLLTEMVPLSSPMKSRSVSALYSIEDASSEIHRIRLKN